MNNAASTPHSTVSGVRARGLDRRALDRLGVTRPFSDVEVARAELRRWGGGAS